MSCAKNTMSYEEIQHESQEFIEGKIYMDVQILLFTPLLKP